MCTLQEEIRRFKIDKDNPIVGYRGWFIKNPFDTKEKYLVSLNNTVVWAKNTLMTGNVNKIYNNIPLGIYCYNYNYYNSHYNNYYSSYYNYYYNSSYYNYSYYNYYYNYYYVAGICNIYGNIVEHKLGYRASFGYPKNLVLLKDHPNKEFLNHFNKIVELVAKEYNILTISQDEYETTNIR